MKVMVFDTETSGFLKKSLEPSDPLQGRMCQFAAILLDTETNEHIAKISTLIRPDGWEIQEGAQKIHGISTEKAAKYGVESKAVLSIFLDMFVSADLLVAHNIRFDIDIIENELKCLKNPIFIKLGEENIYCTMLKSVDICKIPGRYGKYKWPKLSEAYKHFFNEELEGAHDALVDVEACARIFMELNKGDKHNGE